MAMQQGELIDEAVERAGIDPTSLTHRHLNSIKTSLMLVFKEIEKAVDAEYRMVETTIAIPLNAKAVPLPASTIDVADIMIVKSNGEEIPCRRISRQDYLNVNRSPTLTVPAGIPAGWWVSKSMPGEVARLPQPASASDNMLLVLWPAMGESGGSVRVSYIRETVAPGFLGDAVDARNQWLEVIAQGLASKVAQKYNYARYKDLRGEYMGLLGEMDENRHPVVVGFRAFGYSRTRRH
jgi:hypothetical protein